MRDDCQSGHQPELRIGQERRRDQNSIGEIVHAVAHQDHPASLARFTRVVPVTVGMAIAFVVMRMPQNGKFFQQEEAEQTRQQGGEQGMGVGLRFERGR